jgi:hypothetical protein
MGFERWGSLSVDDHVDTDALAANILLYDRLVVPVMTSQPDRDERAYWVSKGWDPDLQKQRLDELEDLAVPRPWNSHRRGRFRARLDELRAEQGDANNIDAQHMTRMILAQEKVIYKPPGVQGVTVVAAYNSGAALNRDFPVADAKDHIAAQAYLVSRRLAVPDLPSKVLIRETIKLSRDPGFAAKRTELFDWQELAVARRWSPEQTIERISDMTEQYNAKVQEAVEVVRWKFAFTLFGIGLGFATGGPVGAGAAAALSLVQFVKLDRKPAIEAGSTQPAAMFHDMKVRLGIELAQKSKKS